MTFTQTQKRAAAWAGILLALVLPLWLLAPVLTPFVVAAVLAYALTPLVDWLDRVGGGRLPRLLAVVLVEVLFIVALLSMVLLIVPIVSKELPLLREQVPVLLERINSTLKPALAQIGIGFALDVASIKAYLLDYLNGNYEDALRSLLAFGQLFGFVGVLIALPASAVLLVAMRRARAAYLSSRLYQA